VVFPAELVKAREVAVRGSTVTSAIWLIATPFAIAETVFRPAVFELNVPEATPLELVGPVGWVRVFPLPVALRTTVAPLTGVPLASLAVTVMVDELDPLLAMIVCGAAVIVD